MDIVTRRHERRRRRTRQAGRIGLTVVLSLLVHLLLVRGATGWLLTPAPVTPPLEVTVLPPEPAEPEPRRRLVETPATPDTRPPDDARFLSERDTRVEQEQSARRTNLGEGPAASPAPARPRSERPAEQKAPQARAPQRPQPPQPEPAEPAQPEPPSEEAAERAFEMWPTPSTLRSLAGGPEHVPEVKEGDETWLNSREFRYATYFNALRRQVGRIWTPAIRRAVQTHDPQLRRFGEQRITVVLVTLNAEGVVKDVRVAYSSGLAWVDEAAVEAFRRAERFPNPPKGLIDAQGRIVFDFAFIYSIDGSRMLWRRG